MAEIEEDKELLARVIKWERKLPYSLTVETTKDGVVYCRTVFGGHVEYKRTAKVVEYKDVRTDQVLDVPVYTLVAGD